MSQTKILVEDTSTANAPNIATTDENLSVDQMFQQSSLPSLGRSIFPVIPMHGPTAALFNIRKKPGTNDFELLRNNVEVYPSESIKTGLTQETIQDMRNQYGKEANNVIGSLLRGLSNDQENTRTLAFLDTNSLADTDLILTNSKNAEQNVFEITQRVQELVLKTNSKSLRSYSAFAVVPYKALGGVMALNEYVGSNVNSEFGLFITRIGKTSYFLNPDATSTTAYVGIKDINPSKSSAVFSPYKSTVTVALDPDTGNQVNHIFNRFAITQSPLHTASDEMLHKFTVVL